MSSIKNNILYFVILNIFIQIQSLVELPAAEDNSIVTTEAAIRNTINTVFSIFKLRHIKNKGRFIEYSTIHNLFVSITLQDHKILNKISKLARVDKIDNKTQDFITQLNEVLNEDNKLDEATNDVYVTKHIGRFIKKLEQLKYKYGFYNHSSNFDINRDVLKHLKRDHLGDVRNVSKGYLYNLTEGYKRSNDLDNSVLSEDEYWKPSGRRIFEGHRVKIKKYPFMASVQFFKKFQCGGSIIKSDLVITSASCLQLAWNNRFFRENPAFLSVQVGCDFYERGDENIPVMEVYFHPGYDPKSLRDNLAVMRLQRVLKFGKKVKRIKKIEFDRNASPLPATSERITVIGWGARSISNILRDPWANRLGVAHLDFYPWHECKEIYSSEYITRKNFCAGFFSKGGGACNRDVGGPGVLGDILMGVISFGSPTCGTPDSPTVFTKLGYYADWLEELMAQDVPRVKHRTTARPRKISYSLLEQGFSETTLHLLPVTDNPDMSYTPGQKVEALRKDDKLFKEFIATMFNSDEKQEYLDQYVTEDNKPKKSDKKPAKTTKGVVRQKVETKEIETSDTDSSDSEPHVIRVTKIENFDAAIINSQEYVSEPSIFKIENEYELFDTEKAKKNAENILMSRKDTVQKNIAKLISDIDLRELFESNESTTERIIRPQVLPMPNKTGKPLEPVQRTLETNNYKDSVSSDDYNESKLKSNYLELQAPHIGAKSEDTQDDSTDEDSDKPLTLLNDVSQFDRKEDSQELSIPLESFTPFNDFEFKQPNVTGLLDIFSQDELLNLLTESLL